MIRKWVGEWLALSAPGGCATGPSVAGVAGVAGVLGIAGVRLHRHAVHPVSVFGYHGRRPQLCCVQLRASMPFTPKLPGNPPRNRPSPMRLEGGGGGLAKGSPARVNTDSHGVPRNLVGDHYQAEARTRNTISHAQPQLGYPIVGFVCPSWYCSLRHPARLVFK